jgi:uncharacterized membrane protein YkgB
MPPALHRLEARTLGWIERHAEGCLRVALGVVFLLFGALKLLPDASPAIGLVAKTVGAFVDPTWFVPVLALWECAIGAGLLTRRLPRLTLLLLFAHMPGTFLPMLTCPEEVWVVFPYAWTLEGQYIVKNLVLVAGALILVGRLRRHEAALAYSRLGR